MYQISRTLSFWRTETLYLLNTNSFTLSPALGNYLYNFLFLWFDYFRYFMSRTMQYPLRLAYLPSIMFLRVIHVVACDKISFFFKVCVIFHCMHTPYSLFHSSTDGHSGCFHILAIENYGAMLSLRYLYANISFENLLWILWIHTQKWDCWVTQ